MSSSISGREIARRDERGDVVVRVGAQRCRLRLSGLETSNQHAVDLTFSFSVEALDQPAERAMLAETFLTDRDVLLSSDVAAYFTTPLRETAAKRIAGQPVEYWLDDAHRGEVINALKKAAEPLAFASGVELLAPFDLLVESPTAQREKIEAMQRTLTERRAAGQAQHVQRATELLKQFQALRDASGPGMSPGKILEQVSPADRGTMLETLLMASASEQQARLFAVAGPNLVKIEARHANPPRCDVVPLPTDLGPLRSVQAGEGTQLLVGAQSGVIAIDPNDVGSVRRYADRGFTGTLGFNSVAASGGMIWATHGEAGVVVWNVDEPDKPAFALRPASPSDGARNLVVLDDTFVLYSAGAAVKMVDSSGNASDVAGATSRATVLFIHVDRSEILIVRGDGSIEHLDRNTLQRTSTSRHCGETTSAAALPWLGTTRILLATAEGPVCCVGLDDPLVTQYVSAHRGLRAIAASGDLIAGLSADRQRIVLWKSWDGRQVAGDIHIANVARHRAADVCFA